MSIYAVAMSGGVDSSTVAALLKSQGHKVFGVTMLTSKCEKIISDAKQIADLLHIDHYVLDVSNEFKTQVIDYFINSYCNGLTPNPCAICNRDIKLNLLLKFAKQHGADYLATGHYASIDVIDNKVYLKESINAAKDQSYFLSLVPKDNLKYVRFPLSNLKNKQETRELAKKFKLPNFDKSDSQDICFISCNNHVEFIKQNIKHTTQYVEQQHAEQHHTEQQRTERQRAEQHGDIKLNGKKIGEHNGIINYTIGQRRGLNISHFEPLYVINIYNNDIEVGNRKALIVKEFSIKDVNWLLDIDNDLEYYVKIRAGKTKFRANIIRNNISINNTCVDNTCVDNACTDSTCVDDTCANSTVRLLEPNTLAVCQGQICTVYDRNNIVVCAGIIQSKFTN